MYRLSIFALCVLSISATSAFASCLEKATGDLVVKGGIATDRTSGLVWNRCAIGMEWNTAKKHCTGEPEALSQEAARKAAENAGNGWRIPTGEELETLLINLCAGPQIDSLAFPDIEKSDFGEGAKFWTSTEALPGMFYFFDFVNGYADMHSAGYGLSVLLVRDQ